MERYTMFMDQKIDYCQNFSYPQIDPQIKGNSNKIPKGFFGRDSEVCSKIHIEMQRFTNRITLRKKNKVGGLTLPDVKTYYSVRVNKMVSIGAKTDKQINGAEQSPEADAHIYGQLILDKDSKPIQQRNDSVFKKWCWNSWISICKKEAKPGGTKREKQTNPQLRLHIVTALSQ